jgi:hypothetical protein
MRVTWIGGWGVAPESLRPLAEKYFAQSQHAFAPPTTECVRQVLECGGPPPLSGPPVASKKRQRSGALQDADADVLIAWSLGAWRVLEAASRGLQFPGMVLLFAPFVAFPSELQLGGRASVAQVRFLHRWVQRDPLAALGDFYQRVRMVDAPKELPYALPDLLEGLDRLAEDASPALREFAGRGLPKNWQAFIGDNDALLDGAAVCRSLPGCVLLRGAGHAIAELLAASQAK